MSVRELRDMPPGVLVLMSKSEKYAHRVVRELMIRLDMLTYKEEEKREIRYALGHSIENMWRAIPLNERTRMALAAMTSNEAKTFLSAIMENASMGEGQQDEGISSEIIEYIEASEVHYTWLTNRDEWLEHGMKKGYISNLFCLTHDRAPMTQDVADMLNEGNDPCLPSVRVWESVIDRENLAE